MGECWPCAPRETWKRLSQQGCRFLASHHVTPLSIHFNFTFDFLLKYIDTIQKSIPHIELIHHQIGHISLLYPYQFIIQFNKHYISSNHSEHAHTYQFLCIIHNTSSCYLHVHIQSCRSSSLGVTYPMKYLGNSRVSLSRILKTIWRPFTNSRHPPPPGREGIPLSGSMLTWATESHTSPNASRSPGIRLVLQEKVSKPCPPTYVPKAACSEAPGSWSTSPHQAIAARSCTSCNADGTAPPAMVTDLSTGT